MQQKRKEKYRFRKKLSLCDLTNKNTFYKMLHKLAHLRTCKNTAQNIHRTLQKRLINKSTSNEERMWVSFMSIECLPPRKFQFT